MLNTIFPIIEGHGEVSAVRVLLMRFADEIFQNYELRILPPYRLPRGQMIGMGHHLENAVELGARRILEYEGTGAIIILLDADDDCPAELGPTLLTRAKAKRPEIECKAILANKEYEAWFLAAAVSLRGKRHVRDDAVPPSNPEAIRGAKEYLERELMQGGHYYSETTDQAALTAYFSFAEARNCSSFTKLERDLTALFAL